MRKIIFTSLITLIFLSACTSEVDDDNSITKLELHSANLLTSFGEFVNNEGKLLWNLVHKYDDSPQISSSYIDGFMTSRSVKTKKLLKTSSFEILSTYYDDQTLKEIENSFSNLRNMNKFLMSYYNSLEANDEKNDDLSQKLESLYLSISNIGSGGSDSLVLFHIIDNPARITENYTDEEIINTLNNINKQISEVIKLIQNEETT
ncbi:hypothetical protein E3U55_15540 [Filobacillus milosensis]|uniref:Uncharacterized protein n=1 Tax=Filobacillus milosensis TaxID=94137 RepID=A0A4Y8ICQ7_9BACI|nr:hypothetical protein [Filobacillus milosensis]TFB13669.1 hypothetical protein E3U55_15540 [Filobacillus milosensis]